MSQYFTEPTEENSARVPLTGSTAIEVIAVTLSDGTAVLIAREGYRYRLSVSRQGEAIVVRSIPASRLLMGDVLDELSLDSNARATLYTLLTLRSLAYPQK